MPKITQGYGVVAAAAIATKQIRSQFMEMPKFRRKGFAVEIEAVQLTADNADEVSKWSGNSPIVVEHDALDHSKTQPGLNVGTFDGNRRASVGDFIVKDLLGEFHVRQQGDFLSKYEPVD